MRAFVLLAILLVVFPALGEDELPKAQALHKERRISVTWEDPWLVAEQGWDETSKKIKVSSNGEFDHGKWFCQLDSDPEYEFVSIQRGMGSGPNYWLQIIDFPVDGILTWNYYSSGKPLIKGGQIYLNGYQLYASPYAYERYVYTSEGLVKQEEGVKMPEADGGALVDFTDVDEPRWWRPVNDGAMGGLSESQIEITEWATAVFSGKLSLENNGGFASVRRDRRNLNFAESIGVKVHVKGDGRTYQFRVQTKERADSFEYRAEFVTEPDKWMELAIPFSSMKASSRGADVPGAAPLKPENINEFVFLIADKSAGAFRLEVDYVKGYTEGDAEH